MCHGLLRAVWAGDDVSDHRDDAEAEEAEGKQRREPHFVAELPRVDKGSEPGHHRRDGPAQDRQRPNDDEAQRGPRAGSTVHVDVVTATEVDCIARQGRPQGSDAEDDARDDPWGAKTRSSCRGELVLVDEAAE
jgi:hypothetical protein